MNVPMAAVSLDETPDAVLGGMDRANSQDARQIWSYSKKYASTQK